MRRDKGYAWVVLLGVILNGTLIAMAFAINGVFMLEYSRKFGVSSDVIMWVGALRMTTYGFGGLMTGQVVHRFGSKTTGVLGSILIVICNIVSSIYTNIYFLYFSYGVVNGFGYSCINVASMVAAQQYFYKRRALAGGFLLAGQSIGTFLFPPLINYLYNQYGLNGAILLEGGIMLQGVLFSMLFRPFVSHEEVQTRIQVSHKSNIDLNGDWTSMPILAFSSNSVESLSENKINVHTSLSDITQERSKMYLHKPNSNELQNNILYKTKDGNNIEPDALDDRCKTISNLDSAYDNCTQRENTPNPPDKSFEKSNESSPLFEVLQNKAFVVASIGSMFGQAGHVTVFSLVPLKGVEIGSSRENATLLLSIIGMSNIFLRGLCGFVSDFQLIAPRRVLFSGITYSINGAFCLIMTMANSFNSVVVIVAAWGCLSAYYSSISGIIVRDTAGSKFLAIAFGVGLSMCSVGWFTVMIGSGYLLTQTGRSFEAYILCGLSQILGGLLIGMAHFVLQKQKQTGDGD